MSIIRPSLPKTIGLWIKPDSPHNITAANIFDYMDGAGELYLGYRFSHLESYEYKAENQQSILVELYFMKTSDDAFGLLSLDWGGESVNIANTPDEEPAPDSFLWPRALYGQGLLRLWSDTIYARIMAYQETPQSKEAVLALGQAVAREKECPPAPRLLKNIPDSFPSSWTVRRDRVSYFRSHLVLNSLYYLGQENMLDLNHNTEAVTAPYERTSPSGEKERVQFLLVKYPGSEEVHSALAHFHRVYLPEVPFKAKPETSKKIVNTLAVEDGWLGYKLQGNTLAFIFECPDQKTARAVINQI